MPPTPLPPLPLAVTGHRFLADMERLAAGVELAMDRLQATWPSRSMRVLSALAEGADRLVAGAVLRRGGTLWVPLPLPAGEYARDFADAGSREEFVALLAAAERAFVVPSLGTRTAGYTAAGRYAVEQAEALIALWDGQPAQGIGGTADIVALALARHLPLLHIKTGNRLPGTNEPTTLGPEQGRLVVYNWPAEPSCQS